MATLTEASITSRKTVRYIIYSIIGFIVLRIAFSSFVSLYKKLFPPPPTPATVAFGKLPKLKLPERTNLNIQFSLETADGSLPVVPNLAKVYFMPKISSNLLSLDFASEKAKKLGFVSDAQQISESIYKFSSQNNPSSLETNIVTGSFSISYDLNADPSPLSVRPPQPELALTAIKSYLSSAALFPADLSGPVEHKYLKTQAGGFVTALAQSDANLVRIDIFRKKYDELPVLTNTPGEANIWFMVSGIKERGKEIIAGEYHYFPADESQFATYPLKNSELAWQEFSNGKYFTASQGSTVEGDSIKIRKIYLAYFDAGVYAEFLQPIYVFEGDKDFVGYVPAITDDFIGE